MDNLRILLQNDDLLDRVSLLASHPFSDIAGHASQLESLLEQFAKIDDALSWSLSIFVSIPIFLLCVVFHIMPVCGYCYHVYVYWFRHMRCPFSLSNCKSQENICTLQTVKRKRPVYFRWYIKKLRWDPSSQRKKYSKRFIWSLVLTVFKIIVYIRLVGKYMKSYFIFELTTNKKKSNQYQTAEGSCHRLLARTLLQFRFVCFA